MYQKYVQHLQKTQDIQSASSILHWDMETYMPSGGGEMRGRQLATLSTLVHEKMTSPEFERILYTLRDDETLGKIEKANVLDSLRSLEREKKLSEDFVEKLSLAGNRGFNLWQKAHKENDFDLFAPQLEKLVDLNIEKANRIGFEGNVYNALLGNFEPNTTTDDLDHVFEGIKKELVPLVKNITESWQANAEILKGDFDPKKQWELGIYLLEKMGYDFNHGRMDHSLHPFSTSFGPEDCRITTNVKGNDLIDTISSCVHEGGHALYEQGVDMKYYGLPAGKSNSYGIHESMSRFYENNIGRSLSYWKAFYPKVQELFPEKFKNIAVEDFYKAMNIVKPSFIRTAADEVTYHFHIIIRYEIELALLNKKVKVKELPELWNSLYKKYLGLDVPSNKMGVLQDVHWSDGSFGYFPTYSLGSFYAAQWEHSIKKEFSDFTDRVERGELRFIKEWLHKNIYMHGRIYFPDEMCVMISGEKLNPKYFVDYIKGKFGV